MKFYFSKIYLYKLSDLAWLGLVPGFIIGIKYIFAEIKSISFKTYRNSKNIFFPANNANLILYSTLLDILSVGTNYDTYNSH